MNRKVCKCKFKGKKCNSNQKWNNDKCWCVQTYVCSRCHDFLMKSMSYSDSAILNIKVLIIAALLVEIAKVKL